MDEYWSLTNHHTYLFVTSHFSLISAAYCYKNGISLWIIPAGVYINSINYWRRPAMGWRRNIDIGYAVGGCVCQSVIAYRSPIFQTFYFSLLTASLLAYPLSGWFYRRKQYVASTFAHSFIHILANVANVGLYYSLLGLSKNELF
jgi:hypothetical protein